MPTPSTDVPLDRRDVLCVGALLLLGFCLIALRYGSLPLQIWDEARLANSALEMAHGGHWLVPSYDGIPDHWSVKPPLLIWQMAGLMRLGLPPLLAVRLPVMLAALATVGAVWWVCRFALRDRVAAALAGFVLLSSLYYTDIHIARTGDYDVPLGFFTLCYVLAFWASIERGGEIRMGWFAISAAALVLAVMTKGVAGTFALIGILVFSSISGRLVMLLSNVRVWSLALLALALCLGYYVSRELYDPGYLQAVWQNELAGRFTVTNEGHQESPLFYVKLLIKNFEPAVVLLPFAALTVFGTDARRRSMTVLCLSCAAAMFFVLTTAQTKIYWYATPIVPFLAIAAALGVSDGLRWIKAREERLPGAFHARPLKAALAVLLALVSAVSLYRNQVVTLQTAQLASNGQLWYGELFEELQARGNPSDVVVIDSGFGEWYNPMLKFYAEIARTKGLRVISAAYGTPVAVGELVATCDPKLVRLFEHRDGLTVGGRVRSCVFGITGDPSQITR